MIRLWLGAQASSWVAAPHGSLGVLSEAAAFSFCSGRPPCSTSALLASRRQMSGPTTDDGGPWSFDSLMNSSDEEDETDMPDNKMTVITVECALFAADQAASGEPDAETAAEIDKLFKANSVLGGVKSDNCTTLAKQVGVQPGRLFTEFKKRRAASGTKRASGKRAGVGKSGKKKAAVQKTIKKKSPPKKKPLAPCTANKPAPMGPPQLPPEPMSPPPGWA